MFALWNLQCLYIVAHPNTARVIIIFKHNQHEYYTPVKDYCTQVGILEFLRLFSLAWVITYLDGLPNKMSDSV